MQPLQKVLDQVKELSIADLRILNKFVIETVNSKKDLEGLKIGSQLKVNMKVKINNPKFVGKTFIVQKINRKKAVVRLEGTFNDYDAPFSVIIIDEETK